MSLSLRVVIIEWDDGLRVAFEKIFGEYMGHKIVASLRNGKDGLSFLVGRDKFVDLVFVNLGLDYSGEEVIRKIKKLYPRIKTILSSGWSEEELEKAATSAGADGFILKPFDTDGLRKVIERVFN
mgnify:FL=1